jgi:hypothetical protein
MVAGGQSDIAEWKADSTKNIGQGNKQWPVLEARAAAQSQ